MKELTSMQAANWFGRGASVALGGVSAHLYVEFDGHDIDLKRLSKALERLFLAHPMLRLQVNADGMQSIAPSNQSPRLEVDDFTLMHAQDLEERLQRKRSHWSHQKLDLIKGQASRFSVSLLPSNAFRLHVDTDMVAVDPSSLQRLMEDLALLYENNDAYIAPIPSFFDWYDKIQTDPHLKANRDKDRNWWQRRLSKIAPAPSLPLNLSVSKGAHSHRLSAWLHPSERQALRQLSRKQRISFSSMMLGLFAAALGNATGDQTFRLNVPVFWRPPVVDNVEKIVGDFVNLLLLNVDLNVAGNLAALCQNLASQMIELLGHCTYSGVSLMRDLSRHHGSPQISPVVFTAALDLPTGDLFSPHVQRAFGKMNWAISQGPQVALDAQVASLDGGILINWDVRLDALPEEWVTGLFNDFVTLVKEAAVDPKVMNRPVKPTTPLHASTSKAENPLTPMQRAYLFGRTAQQPLGGVGMQDFREYHGVMNPALLRSRLSEMVQRYECLRTFIDAERLVKTVSDEAHLNLHEIDLSKLPSQEALKQVRKFRDTYSHSVFDLNEPPWNITLYRLKDDFSIIFSRFDGLILDGQSVSTLMVELIEGRPPVLRSPSKASPNIMDAITSPKEDAAYWKTKLFEINDAIQLPWSKPLNQIKTSRYQRKSLTVKSAYFKKLTEKGAKKGLFKNTVMMALILEVLIHWSERKKVCVAVPVMPLHAEAFSSSSTFIAVSWDIKFDSFIDRAKQLQIDILEGLNHLSFSGVDLTRLLFENCGSSPVLPVVLTNGLSWPSLSESSPMKLNDGLTLTPQVAIDIRFVTAADGDLIFNIDYAIEAINSEKIDSLLGDIDKSIKQLIESENFSIDSSELTKNQINSRPINQRTISTPKRDQILDIYLDVLKKTHRHHTQSNMDFITLGLLPKHLKTISARLKNALFVEVTPAQLLSCRNLDDVEHLLEKYRTDRG